ncbi:MAG: anti-sigma factor [Bacteroidetes bacterium]|nr:anti-sigma factor [Bacteroidota bacterium]
MNATDNAQNNSSQRQWNWIPFGVAVALLLATLFSAYVLRLLDTIQDQNRQLVLLSDEVIQKREFLTTLASKRIEVIELDGRIDPLSYGKIFLDPDGRKAVLQVADLPSVPPGKEYRLWLIKDNTAISAFAFALSDTNTKFLRIEDLPFTDPRDVIAFSVTLEPKGGRPHPTGELYLMGTRR